MKTSIKKSLRQRTRTTQKVIWVAGALGISTTLVIGWMVFMNFQEINSSKATGNKALAHGGTAENGEILCEFTWEKDPVTVATLGPDAISCSGDAHSSTGGRSSTRGLAAGSHGKNIDMVLESGQLFDQDGISVNIDYRGTERNGYFISRGINFYFGIENGFLTIAYRVEDERNGSLAIRSLTDFEVPGDDQFRTYRFFYSPLTGRGEISVNGAPVWSHQGSPNRAMYWKNAGHLMIGKGMNGDGLDKVILDNLVIRSTGTITPLSAALINFMLESQDDKVTVHFAAVSLDQINSFTIERSINGNDFTKVGSITCNNPASENGDEFQFADPNPASTPLVYYRLKQHLKNGKTVVHPVSAIRIKTEKNFSIERVNPSPFDSSFSVSYFLPASGRVWIQLEDMRGSIISSKTFQAEAGKNIHHYREEKPIVNGTYSLNIMYNNKKVSTQIVKI